MEEQLLGPDDAMDGLLWSVADSADGVGLLALLLGTALVALTYPLVMHRNLIS